MQKQGFIYTNNVFPCSAILLVYKNNPQINQIVGEIIFPYCPFRGKEMAVIFEPIFFFI